jgi:hypothetical protein
MKTTDTTAQLLRAWRDVSAASAELNKVIGFIWQRAADIETERGTNETSTELRKLTIQLACGAHEKP